MVRSTRYLEIIEEEKLLDNVKLQGKILRGELVRLQEEFPNKVSNIRNRGLFGAFDISETEMRNKFIKKAMENGLFILSCGEKSVRFRPVLNIKADCILEGFDIIRKTVRSLI
jgi:L-lysine 6-transaminase